MTLDRFWDRVDKTGECWLWQGPPNNSGYGQLSVQGETILAHRYAYEEMVGPIPEGLQLDHLADKCTSRLCVNPDHLEPVTNQENTQRAYDTRRKVPRQDRFVLEYLIDLNATQAAIRAGYSVRTAYSQGQRLLKNVEIQSSLTSAMAERSRRTEIDQDWVIQELVKNVAGGRSLQSCSDSNKALELLGKHLQMFPAGNTLIDNRTQIMDVEVYGDSAIARLRDRINTLAARAAEGDGPNGPD